MKLALRIKIYIFQHVAHTIYTCILWDIYGTSNKIINSSTSWYIGIICGVTGMLLPVIHTYIFLPCVKHFQSLHILWIPISLVQPSGDFFYLIGTQCTCCEMVVQYVQSTKHCYLMTFGLTRAGIQTTNFSEINSSHYF